MNWYNRYKIIFSKNFKKTAGVEDFVSGVMSNKIDSFPEESLLTKEQRDALRELSHKVYISISEKTSLFRKYPNVVYYSFFHLEDYINYNYKKNEFNDDISDILYKLLEKIQNNERYIGFIPSGFNEKIYNIIINQYSHLDISMDLSSYIEKRTEYPEIFINYIKNKHPEEYEASTITRIDDINPIIDGFLSMPSIKNYNKLKIVMKYFEKTNNDSFQQYKEYLFKQIISQGKQEGEILKIARKIDQLTYRSGSDPGYFFIEVLQEVINSYNSKKLYIDESIPFFVYIINFGNRDIPTINFGRYKIDIETIRSLIDSINDENAYYRIIGEDGKITLEKENVDDTYNNLKVFQSDLVEMNNMSSFTGSGTPLEKIKRVLMTDDKTKKRLSLEFFYEGLNQINEEEKEHFFIEVLNSSWFNSIVAEASNAFGSVVISKKVFIKEEDEDTKIGYDSYSSVMVNCANEILSKMPVYIRSKGKMAEAHMWYVLCSGMFPCNLIIERALQYPSDALKVIDGIKCIGDVEKTKSKIREICLKREEESKKIVKSKLPDFVDKCEKKKFSDFPKLFSYVQDLINQFVDRKEKKYSGKKGLDYITHAELVMETVSQVVIYFISPDDFISYFGSENLQNVGWHPDTMNGMFSPQFNFSDNNPSIIIFKHMRETDEGDILSAIGVPHDSDFNNIGEEGTLWHEAVHAVMNEVLPREYGSMKDKTIDKWMVSPSEILAISYGNLQHVKRKLYDFFNKQIPLSGQITEGLLNHITSEILQTFVWEFQGMEKGQALNMIKENIEDFEEQVKDVYHGMSKEEHVKLLTNMFTRFFMGSFMRGKVELQIKNILKDIGGESTKMKVKEEIVIPEKYEFIYPGQQDKFMKQISQREDYKEFIDKAKERVDKLINQGYQSEVWNFLHRHDRKTFKKPNELPDLLRIMFAPPATINSVDTNNLNRTFSDIIPPSLLLYITEIVNAEKALMENEIDTSKESIVTPEEAEEAGKFMADMDEDYGKDWLWLAKNNSNWYKLSKKRILPKSCR